MAQEHLDTAQLLAIYEEGDAHERGAREHLATCAECQQSFDDSRWLMLLRRLRGIVEAGPHPSPDELAAYRGHALSSRRIAQIERHLRSCDRCAAAYRSERVVDRRLAYSSPPPSLLKRAQRQFRPRPLVQLGTVLVRQLGEQLGLLFVPREFDRFGDSAGIAKGAPVDRSPALHEIERSRRAAPEAHPASAAGRRSRKERPVEDSAPVVSQHEAMDLFAVSSKETAASEVGGAGVRPASVKIPAGVWELELALQKGCVLLRLLSLKKNASVDGIRVRLARKGQDPSEAVTDQDGRILLPLEPGRSELTIHADPPFALDLRFPADT